MSAPPRSCRLVVMARASLKGFQRLPKQIHASAMIASKYAVIQLHRNVFASTNGNTQDTVFVRWHVANMDRFMLPFRKRFFPVFAPGDGRLASLLHSFGFGFQVVQPVSAEASAEVSVIVRLHGLVSDWFVCASWRVHREHWPIPRLRQIRVNPFDRVGG